MDIVIELLFEILFEATVEGAVGAKSKNIPKVIRYILISVIVLFFVTVIGGLGFMGFAFFHKNPLAGAFLIILALFFAIASIIKVKKMYKKFNP